MRLWICCLLIMNVICHQAIAAAINRQSLHLDWVDSSIPAWKDFYAYANGAWQREHPIPPDYASWDNFRILQQAIHKKLRHLMIQLEKNPKLSSNNIGKKIGDFYFSGMNTTAINRAGINPLVPLLNKIDAI